MWGLRGDGWMPGGSLCHCPLLGCLAGLLIVSSLTCPSLWPPRRSPGRAHGEADAALRLNWYDVQPELAGTSGGLHRLCPDRDDDSIYRTPGLLQRRGGKEVSAQRIWAIDGETETAITWRMSKAAGVYRQYGRGGRGVPVRRCPPRLPSACSLAGACAGDHHLLAQCRPAM